jgi:PmbA protein
MTESLNLLTDLIASARKEGATAADALFYESSSLSVSRRMRNPEGLERSESSGISLRVFVGDRTSVVSSSDTGKAALKELVTRAVTIAKLAPEDPDSILAPEALLIRDVPDLDLYDSQEPEARWLQEQCATAEDAALGVKGITNSEGADASTGRTHFALATSNGFARDYRSSFSSFSVSVLAGEGTNMERDYDFTAARFVSDLASAESIGLNAANLALARLGARKCETQQVPVVYDPRVSKSLLGSFAGAINGSAIARGTSFLKESMGKAVFTPSIRIIDDPLIKRGQGSRPFDAEGVANRKIALIDQGVLQSWLLDMRSAKRLNLTTTGRASRSLSAPPSPSSTNLYMEAGTLSPAELISDIASGFYVTEVFGMGVNLVTGDYSQGASGFWIEKGQKAYPVSEVTVAGKLQDMFLHMTPANDLEFRYSTNAPTLRIEGMTVAGK